MNKDLKKAKELLTDDYSLVLVRDDQVYKSTLKGIRAMLDLIEKNVDLTSFSVADKVVGKAVAFLFIKCKIKAVYALTISSVAKQLLLDANIELTYENEVPFILNNNKDDLCPMEKAVMEALDAEDAFLRLVEKVSSFKNK